MAAVRRPAGAAVLGLALAVPWSSAGALVIELDYRYDTRGFFTDPDTQAPRQERRAVLEAAASLFSGFGDRLAPIAPGAGESWSVSFTHPSLAGPPVTLVDEVIPEDTLRIFVGGSPSAPGVLGFAGVGYGLEATGSPAFVDAVRTRAQPDTTGADATDFAPWGGHIWFNAANDWYFGTDPAGLTPGRPDFLTTATHEIGHILGIGEADSWWAQVDPDAGVFLGPRSVAAHGGPVPLGPYGAHWAQGIQGRIGGSLQETLMDPSTPAGERQLLTDLDYAGLADVGWEVAPIPLPGAAWLLLTALAGGGAFAVRRGPREPAA